MKHQNPSESEAGLDELFRAYRAACPDPEASVNFMPNLWVGIEAREVSTNWFGRVAKTLVTVALAATIILAMMSLLLNRSSAYFNATFVDALRDDHTSALEPLHLDRIADLQPE